MALRALKPYDLSYAHTRKGVRLTFWVSLMLHLVGEFSAQHFTTNSVRV